MTILNHEILEDKYKCNEKTMRYLIYDCCLSLFSYDKDYYYFIKTPQLKRALENMPLKLKIYNLFTGG
jgi:hypothetical protein